MNSNWRSKEETTMQNKIDVIQIPEDICAGRTKEQLEALFAAEEKKNPALSRIENVEKLHAAVRKTIAS
jgi:hypothetical protein